MKWARALESLCHSVPACDPVTALEATAYACCLEGHLLLEREDWHGAVVTLNKARGIYDELCKAGDLDQRDVYSDKISSSVLPALRFCKYNLADERHVDDEGDDDVIMSLVNDPDLFAKLQHLRSKRRTDSDLGVQSTDELQDGDNLGPLSGLATGSIKWCGRRVTLPTDELKTCLLEVEMAFETLHSVSSSAKSAYLESCLTALDEALCRVGDVASALSKGGSKSFHSVSASDATSSVQHLQSFLRYHKLSCFSLRNLELIESCASVDESVDGELVMWSRAQEHAHLYKQLCLTANEMMTLVESVTATIRTQDDNGPSSLEGNGEDDDIISLRLRSELSLYRVCGILALADCYAMTPTNDIGENCNTQNQYGNSKRDMLTKATALVDHADELISSAGLLHI